MLSYQELFELGDHFYSYIGRGTSQEIEEVSNILNKIQKDDLVSPETISELKAIDRCFYLVIAGEMWCPDCHLNISALHKLCEIQPHIKMSIITKGRAEDELMDRLELSEILIPVVAILNEEFELVGKFIERPKEVSEGFENESIKYNYKNGFFLEATIREVLACLRK